MFNLGSNILVNSAIFSDMICNVFFLVNNSVSMKNCYFIYRIEQYLTTVNLNVGKIAANIDAGRNCV